MRRRTFLGNAARLAGGLVVAACTPAVTPQPNPTATGPAAVVPKDLIIGAASEITTGQPFNNGGGGAFGQVFNSLFDTVTRRDVNYKLEPGLAASWRLLDNVTWQFKLRPGVKFHNGDPLTAADIKFSIEHTYDPAAKTIFASSFATTSRIDIVDDLTLNIVHKAPDPFMPDKLSIRPAYVVPKKYFESFGDPTGEQFGRKAVGTGPYKFQEAVTGVSFKLVKNPEYWRGPVEADSITVLVRPDNASRIAALKTGEVNFIGAVPYDAIDDLNAHPATKVVAVPDTGQSMYIMNAKVPPLDNKLIRQALSLSIDREGLNKTLYKGLGVIATGPVMPFEFGFDPTLPKLAYDPARAKTLMQQAGYAGQEIALEYNPTTQLLLDQALAEAWKAVGFNIKLVSMDAATRARKIQTLTFLGITSATFRSFYADPDGVIWRTLQPGGSLRYWTNAEFDRLGLEQASSTDQALRLRNIRRMVQLMLEETVWLSLWEEKQMWGLSRKIDWVPSFGVIDDFGPGHLKFT
jgi:peptide/nickel transport system substrate-binding protein